MYSNLYIAFFMYSKIPLTQLSVRGKGILLRYIPQSNSTSLKIKEFEEDFKLASAYGKSVITGDPVLINLKSEHPFPYQFTALSIQSMNG